MEVCSRPDIHLPTSAVDKEPVCDIETSTRQPSVSPKYTCMSHSKVDYLVLGDSSLPGKMDTRLLSDTCVDTGKASSLTARQLPWQMPDKLLTFPERVVRHLSWPLLNIQHLTLVANSAVDNQLIPSPVVSKSHGDCVSSNSKSTGLDDQDPPNESPKCSSPLKAVFCEEEVSQNRRITSPRERRRPSPVDSCKRLKGSFLVTILSRMEEDGYQTDSDTCDEKISIVETSGKRKVACHSNTLASISEVAEEAVEEEPQKYEGDREMKDEGETNICTELGETDACRYTEHMNEMSDNLVEERSNRSTFAYLESICEQSFTLEDGDGVIMKPKEGTQYGAGDLIHAEYKTHSMENQSLKEVIDADEDITEASMLDTSMQYEGDKDITKAEEMITETNICSPDCKLDFEKIPLFSNTEKADESQDERLKQEVDLCCNVMDDYTGSNSVQGGYCINDTKDYSSSVEGKSCHIVKVDKSVTEKEKCSVKVKDEHSGNVKDEVSGSVKDHVSVGVNDDVSGSVDDGIIGSVNGDVNGSVNDDVGLNVRNDNWSHLSGDESGSASDAVDWRSCPICRALATTKQKQRGEARHTETAGTSLDGTPCSLHDGKKPKFSMSVLKVRTPHMVQMPASSGSGHCLDKAFKPTTEPAERGGSLQEGAEKVAVVIAQEMVGKGGVRKILPTNRIQNVVDVVSSSTDCTEGINGEGFNSEGEDDGVRTDGNQTKIIQPVAREVHSTQVTGNSLAVGSLCDQSWRTWMEQEPSYVWDNQARMDLSTCPLLECVDPNDLDRVKDIRLHNMMTRMCTRVASKNEKLLPDWDINLAKDTQTRSDRMNYQPESHLSYITKEAPLPPSSPGLCHGTEMTPAPDTLSHHKSNDTWRPRSARVARSRSPRQQTRPGVRKRQTSSLGMDTSQARGQVFRSGTSPSSAGCKPKRRGRKRKSHQDVQKKKVSEAQGDRHLTAVVASGVTDQHPKEASGDVKGRQATNVIGGKKGEPRFRRVRNPKASVTRVSPARDINFNRIRASSDNKTCSSVESRAEQGFRYVTRSQAQKQIQKRQRQRKIFLNKLKGFHVMDISPKCSPWYNLLLHPDHKLRGYLVEDIIMHECPPQTDMHVIEKARVGDGIVEQMDSEDILESHGSMTDAPEARFTEVLSKHSIQYIKLFDGRKTNETINEPIDPGVKQRLPPCDDNETGLVIRKHSSLHSQLPSPDIDLKKKSREMSDTQVVKSQPSSRGELSVLEEDNKHVNIIETNNFTHEGSGEVQREKPKEQHVVIADKPEKKKRAEGEFENDSCGDTFQISDKQPCTAKVIRAAMLSEYCRGVQDLAPPQIKSNIQHGESGARVKGKASPTFGCDGYLPMTDAGISKGGKVVGVKTKGLPTEGKARSRPTSVTLKVDTTKTVGQEGKRETFMTTSAPGVDTPKNRPSSVKRDTLFEKVHLPSFGRTSVLKQSTTEGKAEKKDKAISTRRVGEKDQRTIEKICSMVTTGKVEKPVTVNSRNKTGVECLGSRSEKAAGFTWTKRKEGPVSGEAKPKKGYDCKTIADGELARLCCTGKSHEPRMLPKFLDDQPVTARECALACQSFRDEPIEAGRTRWKSQFMSAHTWSLSRHTRPLVPPPLKPKKRVSFAFPLPAYFETLCGEVLRDGFESRRPSSARADVWGLPRRRTCPTSINSYIQRISKQVCQREVPGSYTNMSSDKLKSPPITSDLERTCDNDLDELVCADDTDNEICVAGADNICRTCQCKNRKAKPFCPKMSQSESQQFNPRCLKACQCRSHEVNPCCAMSCPSQNQEVKPCCLKTCQCKGMEIGPSCLRSYPYQNQEIKPCCPKICPNESREVNPYGVKSFQYKSQEKNPYNVKTRIRRDETREKQAVRFNLPEKANPTPARSTTTKALVPNPWKDISCRDAISHHFGLLDNSHKRQDNAGPDDVTESCLGESKGFDEANCEWLNPKKVESGAVGQPCSSGRSCCCCSFRYSDDFQTLNQVQFRHR